MRQIEFSIGPNEDQQADCQGYDRRAVEVAQRVAASICSHLPGVTVEHIGSTSVPGCAGKGIVDLMLLYPDGQLAAARGVLDALGFQRQTTRDPFPEDRPMRTGSVVYEGTIFRLHVHVIAASSPEAQELRRFRDRLRADPDLVASYVAAKEAILAGGITDSVDYCIRKGEFVERVLRDGGRSAEIGNKAEEHQRLIVDQFTKQAIPFSQMPDHSLELILAATEVGATDTVLDVACGPGVLACAFARTAHHVTGIDLTPAMIDQAKIFQQVHDLANLSWRIGHVLPLRFPDASFSLVFTRYSFHHFLDPQAVLSEMVRVCSPGGRVVVVDVFTSSPAQAEAFNRMEKLRDPSHVRALSLEELTGLFHEAGLHNVRRRFYKHEFGLEAVLKGSFPNPGDSRTIRQLFEADLGVDRLGLAADRRDGDIHFAYPIVILVGDKPSMRFGNQLEEVAYTERPAAYAVVAGENGTVAAVKGMSGMMGLPGGGCLPGENAEETVRREVREELARTIRLIRLIGAATQYFYAAEDDRHYKMSALFFLAEFTDGPTGKGEHELFWLSPTEAEEAFFHESHAWAVRRGLKADRPDTDATFTVRPESTTDQEAIRHVNRLAFGQDHEARLVDALREAGHVRVSLVAEQAGQIVGHILFSDSPIITEASTVPALALAPMAVLPEFQNQGIGSALVQRGLEECRQQGHRIVVVLGHAHFYPRFGFSPKRAAHLESPFSGSDSFMAVGLVPGALDGVQGRVQYAPPFDGVPYIRPVRSDDQEEWARMRCLLWPDDTADEHAKEVAAFFGKKSFRWSESLPAVAVFVAARSSGGLCGFLEVSIRPFADGCKTRPVGYVEGWFVDSDMRQLGIGRRLVTAAEQWAAAEGCKEMASDTHLENTVSLVAHQALGFEESSRAIHLRKRLTEVQGTAAEGSDPSRSLTLRILDGTFAICKLSADAPIPPWATAGSFFSITRTAEELSIVIPQDAAPEGVVGERSWRCLRVAGTMPFSVVGVLASLTAPLAQARISVFAVSTFDTDYLLVKDEDLTAALDALRRQGRSDI